MNQTEKATMTPAHDVESGGRRRGRNLMKMLIKKFLVYLGLRHPAKGIKVSKERKAEIILSYKGDKEVFVETGTEFGTTLEIMAKVFKKCYSIELLPELYKEAVEKFKGKTNIELLWGDSPRQLLNIFYKLREPALFWLDAHGPSEITKENAPALKEVSMIMKHPYHHTILIDDARYFPMRDIREIKRLAEKNGYNFELSEGIMRLT